MCTIQHILNEMKTDLSKILETNISKIRTYINNNDIHFDEKIDAAQQIDQIKRLMDDGFFEIDGVLTYFEYTYLEKYIKQQDPTVEIPEVQRTIFEPFFDVPRATIPEKELNAVSQFINDYCDIAPVHSDDEYNYSIKLSDFKDEFNKKYPDIITTHHKMYKCIARINTTLPNTFNKINKLRKNTGRVLCFIRFKPDLIPQQQSKRRRNGLKFKIVKCVTALTNITPISSTNSNVVEGMSGSVNTNTSKSSKRKSPLKAPSPRTLQFRIFAPKKPWVAKSTTSSTSKSNSDCSTSKTNIISGCSTPKLSKTNTNSDYSTPKSSKTNTNSDYSTPKSSKTNIIANCSTPKPSTSKANSDCSTQKSSSTNAVTTDISLILPNTKTDISPILQGTTIDISTTTTIPSTVTTAPIITTTTIPAITITHPTTITLASTTTPPTINDKIDTTTPPTINDKIDTTTPPTINDKIDTTTPPTINDKIDTTTPPTINDKIDTTTTIPTTITASNDKNDTPITIPTTRDRYLEGRIHKAFIDNIMKYNFNTTNISCDDPSSDKSFNTYDPSSDRSVLVKKLRSKFNSKTHKKIKRKNKKRSGNK